MSKIEEKLTEALAHIVTAVTQQTAKLEAGLAEFQNGNRLTGARPIPAGYRAMANNGPGRLVGWSVFADGGTVELHIRDGRDADADPIASLNLADGESSTVWMGPGGVSFGEALFLDRSGTGTLAGSIYLGAVD